MPAPCLVLAALLLTQPPGGTCAPRPLDDVALERVTAGGVQDTSSAAAPSRAAVGAGSDAGSRSVQQSAIGLAPFSSFDGGHTSSHTSEQREASYEGRVDPALLRLVEARSGVVDEDGSAASTAIPYGSGFAAAGSLDARFESGSVAASQDIHSVFTTSATVCFLRVFCVTEEGTYSGRATASGAVTVPAIEMTLTDGAACAAVFATCSGAGSSARSGSAVATGTAPVQVAGAAGGYISAGDASLTVETSGAVRLSDSAQGALRALSVANAARSLVAAGINIARPTAAPRLQQQNAVVQTP